MANSHSELLVLVVKAQQELGQLESTARSLIDEVAASGAQATPRLRALLASGEQLVASVARATSQLGARLPDSAVLPPQFPDRAAVEAVWSRQPQLQQQQKGEPQALVPTPVSQPASSLPVLLASLGAALPGCSLQALAGRQPAQQGAADATAVVLQCGRAFAAVVHLQNRGGLLPLRVGLLSAAEAEAALVGDGSAASMWAPSRHAVFQQLETQAAAALQHFLLQHQQQRQQQQHGEAPGAADSASPLEFLLLWLATCSDIFTRPSGSTGRLLLAYPAAAGGGLLPPLHRPRQLSWRELWAAALNPWLRQAEHLHAA